MHVHHHYMYIEILWSFNKKKKKIPIICIKYKNKDSKLQLDIKWWKVKVKGKKIYPLDFMKKKGGIKMLALFSKTFFSQVVWTQNIVRLNPNIQLYTNLPFYQEEFRIEGPKVICMYWFAGLIGSEWCPQHFRLDFISNEFQRKLNRDLSFID